uniref:Uncharacterized protein n=1 Tax=Oryza nivara TaxID=4536 RepID=A0A0E0GR51_ORYNI
MAAGNAGEEEAVVAEATIAVQRGSGGGGRRRGGDRPRWEKVRRGGHSSLSVPLPTADGPARRGGAVVGAVADGGAHRSPSGPTTRSGVGAVLRHGATLDPSGAKMEEMGKRKRWCSSSSNPSSHRRRPPAACSTRHRLTGLLALPYSTAPDGVAASSSSKLEAIRWGTAKRQGRPR